MHWASLLAVVALVAPNVHALLRFSCSHLVIERLDPLVNPGVVGTPHLHQIVGGNAFQAQMDPKDDPAKKATCTTCTFTEDLSNYWTAVLFFKHTNGSYRRVPQDQGMGLESANGGITVYYIQGEGFGRYNGSKITAFQQGFRMLTGDPMVRNLNPNSAETKSLTFRCFDARRTEAIRGPAPGGGVSSGVDSYALPNKPCPGGIRSQIYFPTCWDGKNLDSPDHKSHVAYTVSGKCPSTHPVQIPQILYEIVWDTSEFNSMWKSGDPNPFVFSMGDPTGLGQHGDYLFGWQGDALQRAMDKCTNISGAGCTTLKTQSASAANKCSKTASVNENVEGWLTSLPGNPPMTFA